VGALFSTPQQPELRQCTNTACGCGRWYDDTIPSNLAPECRARIDRLNRYDAERRAERAAAEQSRSLRAAELEMLDAAGKWDAYHKLPRAVVAERIEKSQFRSPTPRKWRWSK
jgi:hypothetical protein